MKKKLLVFLLVLVMLFSLLAGCAKDEATPDGTSSKTSSESTEEREDITLTILMHGGASVSGIQDDPVTKYVQEKLGITMDVISDNGMDVDATLNAMIASDDLPDIVVAQFDRHANLLVEADAVLPLDDLLETYGQNIVGSEAGAKALFLQQNYSAVGSGTDATYFVPVLVGLNYISGFPQVAPYIRWDVYEQIGAPEVKDFDDLLNVLKQMQDACPQTDAGKKVYAISGGLADGAWNNWTLTAIEAAIGWRRLHNSGLNYASVADPTIMVNGFEGEDAPVWRLFRWFNKAYQMGILDPEAATMKFDQWSEKISGGQVLYAPFGQATFSATGMIENSADKYFMPLPFESYENDSFTAYYGGDSALCQYAISKNCEHPERAMELLNFIWSEEGAYLFANGTPQGDGWDIIDGEAQLKPAYIAGREDGSIEPPLFASFIGTYVNPNTGTPYNLMNTDKYYAEYMADEHTQAYCEKYGVDSPLEIYDQVEHNLWPNYELFMPIMEGELLDKANALNEYCLTNLTKMVFAESDEEFEAMRQEFMSDIKEMGSDEVFAFMSEGYGANIADYLANFD